LELREPNATPYKIDSDPDSDPDPELLSHFVGEFFNDTSERLSLSGSHSHRPWIQLEPRHKEVKNFRKAVSEQKSGPTAAQRRKMFCNFGLSFQPIQPMNSL